MKKVKKITSSNPADIIRRAGFRATKPRISLVSFLQKTKYPLHIQDIVYGLRRDHVDQVTVYRMLDAFKHAKIVREVDFQGERPRYELEDEYDHHHIVCTKCHKLEDFIGCDYERLEREALRESRLFSKITGHSFDLYGLCRTCAKQ